jgi:hypothetical protein
VPENNFDIYQTEKGYTAVTNEVRRTILSALAKKDRGLPDLVKITGKAKPTLSSVHMKDLIAQKLVEELPHPTDNRKKIYRLCARRIGSSSIPVDQLRSAVKQYAALSPLAARLPLHVAFEALAAAPASTPPETLRAQATKLGESTSHLYAPTEPRDLVTGIAALLEQEGVARPLRLDLEHRALELELAPALPPTLDTARLGTIFAGFLDGVLRARNLAEGGTEPRMLDAPRRLALRLPPPGARS